MHKRIFWMTRTIFLILVATSLWAAPAAAMDRVLQAPEDFIAEVFPAKPKPKLLWLSKETQAEVGNILGHAPRQLRQRYWSDGMRTLWVLEEIGKEDLITAGIVVSEGRIAQAKVLIYRESRGMEIQYPGFLKQFLGAMLAPSKQLDRGIDGISGATLSVHAMQRMTRAALYLDQVVREMQTKEDKASSK